MPAEEDKIIIYTDGACRGNPGPGGFGIVMLWQDKRKEFSAGFRHTTNNRMELLAVIEALNKLNPAKKWAVIIRTDSALVHNAVEKGWIETWKRKGWRKSDKKPVLNRDLWEKLDILLSKFNVKMEKVEAHTGDIENERCDELAVEAATGEAVLTDVVYEDAKVETGTIFGGGDTEDDNEPEAPFLFNIIENNDGKYLLINRHSRHGLDKITIKPEQIRDFISKLNEFIEQNGL